MGPVAEKPGVVRSQRKNCWLHGPKLVLEFRHQPLVLRQIVEEQAHHLMAELGAEPWRSSAVFRCHQGQGHRLRIDGGFRLGPFFQLLDQCIDLLHVLQHRHRSWDGIQMIVDLGLVEITGQQMPQPVQSQHGLGDGIDRLLAAGSAALVETAADRDRGLDAARFEPVGQLAVQAPQVDAQQAGSRRNQRFPRRVMGHVLRQAELQGANEHVRPQWVEPGLDSSPSEQGADQRIDLGQHVVDRQRHLLLGPGHFDALVQRRIVKQLQVLVAQHLSMRLVLAAALVDDPG